MSDIWYMWTSDSTDSPWPLTSTTTSTDYTPRLHDWRVEREMERRATRRGRLLALEVECAIRESGV